MRVAAMVNWYGITDVADLVTGPNAKDLRGRLDGRPRGLAGGGRAGIPL